MNEESTAYVVGIDLANGKDFAGQVGFILRKQLKRIHEEKKTIKENIVNSYGISEEVAEKICEMSLKAGVTAHDILRVLGNITQPVTMKMFCNNWRRMHGMPLIRRKVVKQCSSQKNKTKRYKKRQKQSLKQQEQSSLLL